MAALMESSKSGPTAEYMQEQFDFTSSDFAMIASTAAFVDKTLMIRDVYNVSPRILITAPRKFGKTTNMNMMKRFFEIAVDDASGKPKAVDTTENYHLFKDNNFEICKDADFFNEHFGKHPVLYIDFKPLGGITSSVKMINTFKDIVTASFGEHCYLLKNPFTKILFADMPDFYEKHFKKLFYKRLIKDVDIVDLENNFEYLSATLYKHFGKKVFVLIDNYDAYFGSLLLRATEDAEKIISFIRSSIGCVLDDKSVERVLITGVLPVMDGVFPCDEYFIEWYQFLGSHPFTKYYGLTCNDLDNVLNKLTTSDKEKCVMKNIIDDYYNAHISQMNSVKVYNTWSVLQYLRKRTVQSYWAQRRYIKHFETCFKNSKLRVKLEDLLVFDNMPLLSFHDMQWVDESQPLSVDDIFKLNEIITGANIEDISAGEVELFFILFYQIGYLSVLEDTTEGRGFLNIASEEIKYELARALFNVTGELFSHNVFGLPEGDVICSTINFIDPDSTEVERDIEIFVRKIDWYSDFTDVCKRLYMNIVTSTYRTQIRIVCRRPRWNAGRPVILLKNRHHVAICITDSTGSRNAFSAIRYNQYIFNVFDNICAKVIIGTDKHNCSYSSCFREGELIQEFSTAKRRR